MIKEYIPFFEKRLGISFDGNDLIPFQPSEPDSSSTHYLLKQGDLQYIIRLPKRHETKTDFQPDRHILDSLATVRERFSTSAIGNTIPRITVVSDDTMPPAIAESAMLGKPANAWIGSGVFPLLTRRRTRKIVEMACDWLLEFQSSTQKERMTVSEIVKYTCTGMELDWLLRTETGLLDAFQTESLKEMHHTLESETNISMPICPSHGSFAPSNLLIRDGAISGVLHWNAFQPNDHPFSDMWNCLLAAAVAGKENAEESQSRLTRKFLGMGWYHHVVEETVRRFSNVHDVPQNIIRTFLALHIVRMLHRNQGDMQSNQSRMQAYLRLLKRILMFESGEKGLVR